MAKWKVGKIHIPQLFQGIGCAAVEVLTAQLEKTPGNMGKPWTFTIAEKRLTLNTVTLIFKLKTSLNIKYHL